MVEVENEDFVFCVLFPSRRSLKNGVFVKGIADGMTQDDLDAPFDQFFDNSQPFYQVLSVCLYEVSNKFFITFHTSNVDSPVAIL